MIGDEYGSIVAILYVYGHGRLCVVVAAVDDDGRAPKKWKGRF